ncbi:MAG: hypothetical protein GXO63_01880 [Candidatus Micrarchaeota archaeon]|nr:hypothetical protein [Candidatus Micrarchaeota archaeon]
MSIEIEINKILSSRQKMEKLLFLEKKNRGVEKSQIIFIGTSELANYYWCAMKSFLRSKEQELNFFASYLHDRILYSFQLGFIKKLPKKEKMLLRIGDEITQHDIEKLLKEKGQNSVAVLSSAIVTDRDGNKKMIINPSLPEEEKLYLEQQAKFEGIEIVDPEKFPSIRGEFLESTKAEQYPTIRWNFEWDNYVIIGVPDGITDDFVYEFKTTRNKFLMNFIKPVAFAQADLYGFFFKRNIKRVQIYVTEEDIIKTWVEKVDISNAYKTLNYFKAMDEGTEVIPPKKWKCISCKYKNKCNVN